jgi:thiol-disulfide isomerase/thioredoxin
MKAKYAILIVALLVITALSLAIAYKCMNSKGRERFEEPKVRICLFYATWCPHCERYLNHPDKPFDKAGEMAQKSLRGVVFEKIDFEQNKNLANKYDVNSFPSIIAISADGKKVGAFEGNRMEPSDLVKFAKQVSA